MEPLVQELKSLRTSLVRFVIVFSGLVILLLGTTSGECEIFGRTVPCPVLGTPSIATELFLEAQALLVPTGVPVVALGPVSAFFAPLCFALLAAALLTFPYALYLLGSYLWPALHPLERRILILTILPALTLFYIGAALAYFVIIPKTYTLLYSFALPMGVTPMFALDDFLASTTLLTLLTGFAFLLPVGMVLLSRIGLIPATFWRSHWRGALLVTLIFSAIVTPDGSGVTMVFLALPLMILYGSGVIAASRATGIIRAS